MFELIISVVLAGSPLDARVELQLIPISAQVNVLESEHLGSGGRLSVRLNRYLAGYVGGVGHWYSSPSRAQDELYGRSIRGDSYHPDQVLSTWQATLGVESIPLSGTFQLSASHEGEFGLVVRAGLGFGGGRIRLKPLTTRQDGTPSPATFADVGLRLVGDFGAAFRFGFGAFAIHLGPRLSMWSDAATTLNGCTIDDLRAMDLEIRGGMSHTEAAVGPGCRGIPASNDVPLAMNIVRVPREGLVLNVTAELGISWAF